MKRKRTVVGEQLKGSISWLLWMRLLLQLPVQSQWLFEKW